ncbi:hypothetical protein FXB40_44760 [Bradyrhizobium rifense]|uniref:Uncharacterized protein n=1 Tax=Bradyrhizobium rifense TaxID=515499 RepID=A0A5D3JZ88_9BRAD|nr:hypothetical protein [Bradyrhizobium rifense]TYL84514.1 hypothetical protein FXB40_44760 [Bradyrhizobium rifense]
MRTWAVCLGAYYAACTGAVACMGPSFERGIIFEHVPTDIDAPIIVEATLSDRREVGDAAGNQIVVMNVHVDRVIKGAIDARTFRIVVYGTDCTRASVGQGIVLGDLVDVPPHGLMLSARDGSNPRTWSKEFLQKQLDIWNAARNDK